MDGFEVDYLMILDCEVWWVNHIESGIYFPSITLSKL